MVKNHDAINALEDVGVFYKTFSRALHEYGTEGLGLEWKDLDTEYWAFMTLAVGASLLKLVKALKENERRGGVFTETPEEVSTLLAAHHMLGTVGRICWRSPHSPLVLDMDEAGVLIRGRSFNGTPYVDKEWRRHYDTLKHWTQKFYAARNKRVAEKAKSKKEHPLIGQEEKEDE